MRINLLIIN